MKIKTVVATAVSIATLATIAFAQSKPVVDPARVEAMVEAAFKRAPAEWAGRIKSDETMEICSATNNSPKADDLKKIEATARASMKYPDDGKLLGDWKAGEKIAQSGYGMRFTDYPPANPNGGNCYACHQLTKQEVSYGTIGPSLLGYGKIRKFTEADTKAAYEKIYNSHAAFPCSLMPRFGSNNILSIDDIKHLTALLMSPDSPVNQ